MCDENDRRRRLRLLEAAGMAHASEIALDVAELSHEFDVPEQTIRTELEQLEALGLVLTGFGEGLAPVLLTAGRQFLVRRGDVEHEVLSFLPAVIDDLNARKALLVAGIHRLVVEAQQAVVGLVHVHAKGAARLEFGHVAVLLAQRQVGGDSALPKTLHEILVELFGLF